jgi:hypothetical protein
MTHPVDNDEQYCQIWGKFPIWGENDISVEIFSDPYEVNGEFLAKSGQVSIKYLEIFKIPFVVNGDFMDFLWVVEGERSCLNNALTVISRWSEVTLLFT